jgi:hypothetical protein
MSDAVTVAERIMRQIAPNWPQSGSQRRMIVGQLSPNGPYFRDRVPERSIDLEMDENKFCVAAT